MTFSFVLSESGKPEIQGRKRVVLGTWANTEDDTGGEINTGLRRIDFIGLTNFTPSTTTPSVGDAVTTLPINQPTFELVAGQSSAGMFRVEGI